MKDDQYRIHWFAGEQMQDDVGSASDNLTDDVGSNEAIFSSASDSDKKTTKCCFSDLLWNRISYINILYIDTAFK